MIPWKPLLFMKTAAFHENHTKDHQLPGMVTLCFIYFIGLSLERPILEARPKPHESADYGQIHIICGLLA